MLETREVFVSEILYADNANELFQEYTDESMVETLQEVPRPNESKYLGLELDNKLRCVGVFNKDVLVGFAIGIIDILNHHSCSIGMIDSIFVSKDYRKNGTAKYMLNKLEKLFQSAGCVAVTAAGPIDSTMTKFVELYGYKPTNVIYSKMLTNE